MSVDSMSVDLANLYREEVYTDLQSASVRVLTPVLPDGSVDPARSAMYIGDTTLMTQMGPIPVQFPLEAATLDAAFALFPEGVLGAIERLNERAREMAREEASRIMVPGKGPAGGIGGGMGGMGGGRGKLILD
jgi:hypothetical protein